MKAISRMSTAVDPETIVQELSRDVNDGCDLAFLFVSQHNKPAASQICDKVQRALKARNFLACTTAGVIGSSHEVEDKPACALVTFKLEGVQITPFHLTQEQLTDLTTAEEWYDFFNVFPNEDPKFLILPDPFQIDMNEFLNGINEFYANSPLVGGLASGANEAKGNVIRLNDEEYEEGLIGVCLRGNIEIETVVSQGCRPIGENYIITQAEGNIVYELAGRPFLDVLEDVITQASVKDRTLAKEALFIGIAMNEYKHRMSTGDFLIRMLIGVDEESGAAAVGDIVQTGQTVQFHIRDAVSATEDLNHLLKEHQENHPHTTAAGAIVFSCNGRGRDLFRADDYEIGIIQKYIGNIPAAGFFCAGEIGPVGGKNFLHGFTSSIALFYPAGKNLPSSDTAAKPPSP